MGFANRFFYKYVDWMNVVNFVLRVAMVDERPIEGYQFKMKYQKLMALVWMWALLILSQSYAGNLTAMLTRPLLKRSIDNVDDLLNQNDITWSAPSPDINYEIYEYLKASPPGSTMRGLLEKGKTDIEWKTENTYSPCYQREQRDAGTWASLCDVMGIEGLKYRDFWDTGKCNFYTIRDKFFTTPAVMAFQVRDHFI